MQLKFWEEGPDGEQYEVDATKLTAPQLLVYLQMTANACDTERKEHATEVARLQGRLQQLGSLVYFLSLALGALVCWLILCVMMKG